MSERTYQRPDRSLMLAEGPRAAGEFAALISATPFLYQVRRGDGHPVLVLPGFGGTDRSTQVLRQYLASLNYDALPWLQGRNLGPSTPNLTYTLAQRLEEIHTAADGRSVSLVGWSLGGVYARLLAHLYPERVRQVITLGSPFAGHPRSTRAYRVAQRMNIPVGEQATTRHRRLASEPLGDVPNTAIFSKTDGVVPWQIASQQPSANAENIEVYSSHLGLGFNPTVLYALADRLSQQEQAWRPFVRDGWKLLAYGPARLEVNDGEQHIQHPA
jgi:pimeloyl-ACP methyl ester carboxylesterase